MHTAVSEFLMEPTDNITFYKCDVSKWEEVEAVSKKIVEEVSQSTSLKVDPEG